MLVEFSVRNYRSFKERVTLSMEAADIASQPAALDAHNVFAANDELRLLTSAAIYGANASGKSNLIRALALMRTFILTSSRETQVGEPIFVEPYQLSTVTVEQPSTYELVFLLDGAQYRYGFETTAERVVAEWLYKLGSTRETTLFLRDTQGIKVSARAFREGRGLPERTRPNALFLSVAAQFNGEIASHILRWLQNLTITSGIAQEHEFALSVKLNRDTPYRAAIEHLVQRLDVGIEAVAFESQPLALADSMPTGLKQGLQSLFDELSKLEGPLEMISVQTQHQRYDASGAPAGQVAFDLAQHESAGTQRLFSLAGPLLRVLDEGGVLVIDELDSRLHPNLVIELIRLFHSPVTNAKHAQLIFTTHNTNLLSAKLFRRDQVWFIEKSRQGASDLYSLVEYRQEDGKMVRNNASFEKDYIAGRYGAVPFIGDLGALQGAAHGSY